MLTAFTSDDGKKTLSDYLQLPRDVYPVGRLDYDSEGLLLLTNDRSLNQRLLHPDFQHPRSYWVQVEGNMTEEALQQLRKGVTIRHAGTLYNTLPAKARRLPEIPDLPDRIPPVRHRKSIPDTWIELNLVEGKNRQVRKMTAAVGFPTLRLVRVSIGNLSLGTLQPGQVKEISGNTIRRQLFTSDT